VEAVRICAAIGWVAPAQLQHNQFLCSGVSLPINLRSLQPPEMMDLRLVFSNGSAVHLNMRRGSHDKTLEESDCEALETEPQSFAADVEAYRRHFSMRYQGFIFIRPPEIRLK
jgi:hypothetical protein